MTNLTTTPARRRAYTYLCLSSVVIGIVLSACSTTESVPQDSASGKAGQGGSPGGSAGSAAGKAGSSSSAAGSMNSAGSGGSAGGTAGSGGATAAGSGGNGGAGGAACAADDECCQDASKTEPGECGCGVADADSDEDGKLDCKEQCPFDASKDMPGMCGCGVVDNDSDDDGVIDCKPGHFFEAEDGVLSEVDVPVTPIDDGAGGEGGGGAGGAGAGGDGGIGDLPTAFTIGDDAKASALEYIESPAGFTSDAAPGPARASYELDIPADHAYVFWGRFRAPDLDHNRVWIKVDDGVWTKLRVTTGETWFWYTFHKEGEFDMPIQYTLTKGKHTLLLASDSDGVRIDRFYVTPGSDRPPGDDTVCNPPHSIQVGDVCQSSCGMLQGNSCDAVMCQGKTLLPAYDCPVCCML